MKIPYGVADFERMRTCGYAYVDRTSAWGWSASSLPA